MDDAPSAPAPLSAFSRACAALREAPTAGYSISLLSFIEGVSTYELRWEDAPEGAPPLTFPSYGAALDAVHERHGAARVRTILEALRSPGKAVIDAAHEQVVEDRNWYDTARAFNAALDAILAQEER